MKCKFDNNKLGNFSIFSTIFLSLVGFGVFTYSQNIGKILGNNGFFITFIYGLIYMIFVMMIYSIIKLNNYKKLEEILEDLFGKIFGKIFLFLISLFIIFLISMELRIFIDSIKIYILPNINNEFMIGITLLICYYVSKNEDRVLTGINEIMFVFLIISCLVTFFIVYKNIDLSNILPLEFKPINLYLDGILYLGRYLSGGVILFYLIPISKSRKLNEFCKPVIFSFIFLAFIFLLCVGILNINQTINSTWPIILSFTTIDISGGFVERIEGIAVSIAIIFFVINFINLYFYGSYINSKVLGVKEHKVSSIMFVPIIYIIALLPKSLNDVNFIMNSIIFPISIFLSFFVPTLLFLISYLRKIFNKGRVKDEENIV